MIANARQYDDVKSGLEVADIALRMMAEEAGDVDASTDADAVGRTVPRGLTAAWTRARLLEAQHAYLTSTKRFNYVPAGRRSFKTEASKRRLVRAAISFTDHPNGRFFACGPTHQQTKDIFWPDIKRLVPDWAFKVSRDRSISESELRIDLVNGAIIKVAGLDKPMRIEGGFWDGGVIDEYADIKPNVLGEHIIPMMVRGGWIDLIGVPGGRNHYFKEAMAARAEVIAKGDLAESGYFHWTSEAALPLYLGVEAASREILQAKRRLDPLTYAQEYLASFINFEGRAYYEFDRDVHAAERLPYLPYEEIVFCFDFNRQPGVAVVAQEQEYLGRRRNVADWITALIGEVWIPRNSSTKYVCRRLINDWSKHKGRVRVRGDATGGRETSATSASDGSDWVQVEALLRPVFGDRLVMDVPRSNPSERHRVNTVNTRIKNGENIISLLCDPVACPNVVEDFEGTTVIEGGSGEIDKKHDLMRSHITDAVGYHIVQEFGDMAAGVGRYAL